VGEIVSRKPTGTPPRAGNTVVAQRLKKLERRSRKQAARIAELEAQLMEERRLHRRVAELTDVVTELLVPATARDEERVRAAIAALDEPGSPS
jgi:uncharacterized coiled-coil protein SlyX